MKKNWQAPRILVQEFEANEYVAACYDLFCAISGDGYGKPKSKGGSYFNHLRSWGNFTIVRDGLAHGDPCALGSSYDDVNHDFYERNKPGTRVDPSSVNISDDKDPNGPGLYAAWISTDSNGDHYQHYGYAVLNDANRPNHS